MSKATHYGTCQICGAEQKLPKGRLSKHGYTVDFGFFNGVCNGAHGLPFEQSTDLIAAVVADVKVKLADLLAEIENLKTETGFVWVRTYYARNAAATGYQWERHEASELFEDGRGYPYAIGKQHFNREQVIASPRAGERMDIGGYCGGDLAERIVKHNENYTYHLTNILEKAESYITWQEKRLSEWTPGELKAI